MTTRSKGASQKPVPDRLLPQIVTQKQTDDSVANVKEMERNWYFRYFRPFSTVFFLCKCVVLGFEVRLGYLLQEAKQNTPKKMFMTSELHVTLMGMTQKGSADKNM